MGSDPKRRAQVWALDHRRGENSAVASAEYRHPKQERVDMSEQSIRGTRNSESSYVPVVVLALVIALWYAWGLGLVLLAAFG
jgi:hypothetical protein